ncbi:MAG: hypothetical protein NXI22_19680, partial [bacterium]|nr:hypothetical protein [bacterium]
EAVLHNQGDGLNLAICAEIARYHLGEIVAKNKPAGGAMISLQLPKAVNSPSLMSQMNNTVTLEDFSDLNLECTL